MNSNLSDHHCLLPLSVRPLPSSPETAAEIIFVLHRAPSSTATVDPQCNSDLEGSRVRDRHCPCFQISGPFFPSAVSVPVRTEGSTGVTSPTVAAPTLLFPSYPNPPSVVSNPKMKGEQVE